MTPEFPAFASTPTQDGNRDGRIYHVHERVRCLAYSIDDRETLRMAGAVEGFVLYAFVQYDRNNVLRRIGNWRLAQHPDDLLEAMEAARTALDPNAPRPSNMTLTQLIEERLVARPYEAPPYTSYNFAIPIEPPEIP